MQVQILIAEDKPHCIVVDGVTYDLKEFVADAQRYNWLMSGHSEAQLAAMSDPKVPPPFAVQDLVLADLSTNYMTKGAADAYIDAHRFQHTRYVVTTPEYGVFVGIALGLAFWSKIDPVGQFNVPVCHTVAEAEDIRDKVLDPENRSKAKIVTVFTKEADWASIDECVMAGIDRWDPGAMN